MDGDRRGEEEEEKKLGSGYTRRNGIIYGPDGKPCRQCNSLRDLMSMGQDKSISSSPFGIRKRPRAADKESSLPPDPDQRSAESNSDLPMSSIDSNHCPPDVEQLGRSTWTFLHTTAANYPARPTTVQQNDMADFIRTFSLFYPCWVCAEDFRVWMAKKENQPVLDNGWAGLGQWMCRAHNEVNSKLGKPEFDCRLWRQRWKDGFKDGRCDP